MLPSTAQPLPPGGVRAAIRLLGGADEFGNLPQPRTGCAIFRDLDTGRDASLYLRAGRIYAARLSGFTPQFPRRLHAAGIIDEATLDMLDALDPEEAAIRIAADQLADPETLEDLNRQALLSTVTHLYGWQSGTWEWSEGNEAATFLITPMEASLLIAAADERVGQWNAIAAAYPAVIKGDSIPTRLTFEDEALEELAPDTVALIRRIDGTCTVGDLAAICGFARFEIAGRLAKGIADGLIAVTDPNALIPEVDDQQFYSETESELDAALAELDRAHRLVAAAEARVAAARANLESTEGDIA